MWTNAMRLEKEYFIYYIMKCMSEGQNEPECDRQQHQFRIARAWDTTVDRPYGRLCVL